MPWIHHTTVKEALEKGENGAWVPVPRAVEVKTLASSLKPENIEDRISVVITERNRLSPLRMSFESLYRNSRFKDNEIVFVGDRIDTPVESEGFLDRSRDNGITVREWLEKGRWYEKLNLKVYEGDFSLPPVTERDGKTTGGWNPCYRCWSYGAQKAVNNYICMPDSDSYFSPDWDYNILRHKDQFDQVNYCFVPVYAFTAPVTDMNQQTDDHRTHLGFAQLYLIGEENWRRSIHERELLEVYEKRKKPNMVVIEHASHRTEVWYHAHVYPKDVVRRMEKATTGDWGFYGDVYPSAPDLQADDYLWSKLHVYKVGVLDSFVWHLKRIRYNPNARNSYGFIFEGD